MDSLDHVEYFFGAVEPDVVVGDGHGLEGDLLGVLEIGVRTPDPVQPFWGINYMLTHDSININQHSTVK